MLSSGQRMPMIGLGTYKLESPDVVKKALELGYRHFDCKYHRKSTVWDSRVIRSQMQWWHSGCFVLLMLQKPVDAVHVLFYCIA